MAVPDLQKYSRTFNLIKNVEESVVFLTRSVYFCEFLHCFLQTRNTKFTFAEEPQMKIKSSMKQKQWYLIHTWLDKAIKGIAIFAWRVTYSPLKGLCLDIISRVSPIISVNVPFTLLSHQLKLCQQSLKCKRWYLKCFDFFLCLMFCEIWYCCLKWKFRVN